MHALRPLLVLLFAATAGPAAAQTVAVLEPGRWAPTQGEGLSLTLVRHDVAGAAPTPFPLDTQRNGLFVRAAGHQRNMERVDLEPAPAPAPVGVTRARVTLEHGGLTLIGLDLAPRFETIAAARWEAFLAEHLGLEPETTDAPVRLRRFESAKLLLRAGEPDGPPSATATSKTGQVVELRPLVDPTRTPPGADLPFRVYAITGPTDGLLVTARHASGQVERARTGPGGMGHVRLPVAGAWLLEVHQRVRLDGTYGAEWELRSATLAFETPPSVEGADEGEGR